MPVAMNNGFETLTVLSPNATDESVTTTFLESATAVCATARVGVSANLPCVLALSHMPVLACAFVLVVASVALGLS